MTLSHVQLYHHVIQSRSDEFVARMSPVDPAPAILLDSATFRFLLMFLKSPLPIGSQIGGDVKTSHNQSEMIFYKQS